MEDPQSEKIIENLIQARDRAVEIFRENYQEIIASYQDKLRQRAQDENIGILEALYEILSIRERYEASLTQTERMLYSAAAVELLRTPKGKVTN